MFSTACSASLVCCGGLLVPSMQYHLCIRHQASSVADSSLHQVVQGALPFLHYLRQLDAHVQVDHFGESTTGRLHDPMSAAAACWLLWLMRWGHLLGLVLAGLCG